VFDRHDLDRVIEVRAADLINIKLAKCGGLTAGVRLAATARAAGLGVLVGSMMESAVGVCAAATLAAVVSPATVHDLDSAWWTVDGGTGRYRGNRIVLPAGPGLSQVTDQLSEPGSGLHWTVRTGRTRPPDSGRGC
jgi:L-alanine-DL-glutamate epimerase-like enolase superfamily enzyme